MMEDPEYHDFGSQYSEREAFWAPIVGRVCEIFPNPQNIGLCPPMIDHDHDWVLITDGLQPLSIFTRYAAERFVEPASVLLEIMWAFRRVPR